MGFPQILDHNDDDTDDAYDDHNSEGDDHDHDHDNDQSSDLTVSLGWASLRSPSWESPLSSTI